MAGSSSRNASSGAGATGYFNPTPYMFGTVTTTRPSPTTVSAAHRPSPAPVRPMTPTTTNDTLQGYLGRSPPDPNDTRPPIMNGGYPDNTTPVNTRWTAGELSHRYASMHPSMWGRGILSLSGRIATHMGDTARVTTMLAWHTCVALGPDQRQVLSHQYALFFRATVQLFSITDLFTHIVQTGGYPVGCAPMEHYPYLTDNVTIFLVAAWFAQHGIVPGTPDVRALEEFARARRNITSGIEDLNNETWDEEPRSAAAAQLMAIPPWADIQHAPTRPGATPASDPGISASIHAPMDEDKDPEDEPPAPPPAPSPDAGPAQEDPAVAS
ncbi:hypothetical protein C8F04DRAFT_1190638 [Mycena alexandri]|uniref:Uncharacterized protein n=1 Tax=Mycena alexandri TaxID=1745969 RepID=A0AAD6WZ57_9AGAR|nr:hypothetical protein C8F04DRAFT_1190638 [Mycena alexandri]